MVRSAPGSRMLIGAVHESLLPVLAKAGLTVDGAGIVEAVPYTPAWCGSTAPIDAPPVNRVINESFPGESFLTSIGLSHWKSAAQKEAVWESITIGPGQTQIVALPTGSGKSLCFQLVPRFSSGLTLVVVPTVALAIDQQNRASQLYKNRPGCNPLYYAASEDCAAVIDAVRKKETCLVFASPEACVSGKLRSALNDAASEGWLHQLTVDECHLIETWGADFRVEFQLLAAMRRQWLQKTGGQLRTLLLSATLSDECRKLLVEMFSDGSNVRQLISQRVRPEPSIFVEQFGSETARNDVLLESLQRLPRPLIVYVTEVDRAESLLKLIRERLGLRRIECFHGDTPPEKRRELLAKWNGNELDVMVATSAFGLGVDKTDVRTVVHACYPENLDRYYQEIGRSGRDGWSSTCLLLHTPNDKEVAANLTVRLLGPDIMQMRWRAMYTASQHIEGHIYKLPVAARHDGLFGTRTYTENIKWNKRLLIQLQRSGKAELLDLSFEPPLDENSDPVEFLTLKVLFPPLAANLGELLHADRDRELSNFNRGLLQMEHLCSGEMCFGQLIERLYSIDSADRICGGCPLCRRNGFLPSGCSPLDYPRPKCEPVSLQIVEMCPDPFMQDQSDDFLRFIELTMQRKGIRRFVCSSSDYPRFSRIFGALFFPDSPILYSLDAMSQFGNANPEEKIAYLQTRTPTFPKVPRTGAAYIYHLRCGFTTFPDADNRDPMLGSRFHPDYELWLNTNN